MKKINWKTSLLELLTIILGISISLIANEWRISISNNVQERQILSDIHENLLADSVLIAEEIEALKFADYACGKMLSIHSFEELGDSLHLILAYTQVYSTLPVNDIAYQTLGQTGEFKLIKNRELLKEIITLYDKHYFTIKEYNDIDKDLILGRMMPYYEAHLPSDEKPDTGASKKLLEDFQFRNILKNNKRFKIIQIQYYQHQQKLIQELVQKLERELKMR